MLLFVEVRGGAAARGRAMWREAAHAAPRRGGGEGADTANPGPPGGGGGLGALEGSAGAGASAWGGGRPRGDLPGEPPRRGLP